MTMNQNTTTDDSAAARQRLLADLQTAYPGRAIHLAPLPTEAYSDLPVDEKTPDLEELVIASDGPGHYAVTLPDAADPRLSFELYFVHVNDMPGDGQPLGTFDSAADALRAAITQETESRDGREAAALSALDFPDRPGSTTTPPTAAPSAVHDNPAADLGR